jgi:hypothetical protein
MIANVNYNLVESSESKLHENTQKISAALSSNATLKNYIGSDWSVVWDPVISNSSIGSDSFVTDNTMYIAKGKDDISGQDIYVVAIAGTNILSKKDGLKKTLTYSQNKTGENPIVVKLVRGLV